MMGLGINDVAQQRMMAELTPSRSGGLRAGGAKGASMNRAAAVQASACLTG